MKILKFGGTSVANDENIKKVQSIVKKASTTKIGVVVSAFGGVTDLLLNSLELASAQNLAYENKLNEIEERHFRVIKNLFPLNEQSSLLSSVKSELNDLETLLEGSFLIGETTSRLSDKVLSYGELLSSFIISKYLFYYISSFKAVSRLVKPKNSKNKSTDSVSFILEC